MFEPTSANMSLYDLWILVAITAPLALIITVGIAMIHKVEVEGFLLRKGWIKWLNSREERENEKMDQYLKGYYERQKERENY